MTLVLHAHERPDPGTDLVAEVVEIDRLTPRERDQMAGELYAVHRQLYQGVNQADFHTRMFGRMFGDGDRERRLHVLRNRDYEAVGYFAVRYRELRVHRQRVVLAEDESGILPAYRRERQLQRLFTSELLRIRLTRPWSAAYFACGVANPVVYSFLVDTVPSLYPNPFGPTPWKVEGLLPALRAYRRAHPPPPGPQSIKGVNWGLDAAALDIERIRHSHRPAVRFFLRANPLWRDGQSLLVVIPLGLWESLAHLGLFLQALRPTAAR